MKRILTLLLPALTAVTSTAVAQQSYYKSPDALFSRRPDPAAPISHVQRFGPVGLSIDLMQPAFTMNIKGVEAGSPAMKAGLKQGMIIHTINGEKLADIDPRVQLGDMITKAEATDGKIAMVVSDKVGGETREMLVQIPILGKFSETWPLNCPKSDKIVRNFAEYLKAGGNPGFGSFGPLFLLSTGDESDLEHVRKWARSRPAKIDGFHTWNAGLGNLALCEYYLRTGDQEVLPAIQAVADIIVESENNGGWGNKAPIGNLDYGGGGGHLNAGGVHAATTLILAKECGAKIPDESLLRVVRHFYRWAGRGNISYGNNKPEGTYTDNGKNGGFAFTMAAAASLTPSGEDSIYAKARDISALFSFPSTSFMLHGHTGGGIGEIFRSASMGLLHEKRPHLYRDFMDQRRWHYELSRRHDGSFGILDGERYDEEGWGAGYALTFTVPRKTLRLTGAPSKFSKQYALPGRPWGTAEDDDFVSMDAVAYPDGSRPDFSKDTLATGGGLALLKLGAGEMSENQLQKYIRHPVITTRTGFIEQIKRRGPELILNLLNDGDARLRRLALDALAPHRDPNLDLITPQIIDRGVAILNDSKESVFVKEAALRLLGLAPTDRLVRHMDDILPYLEHEEWWLRHSALVALTPVVADKRVSQKVLPALGKLMKSNHLYNVYGPLLWGKIPENLRGAEPEVAALARQELKEAYGNFVGYKHPLPYVEERINDGMRDVMARSMAQVPGGYDLLYEIGKQRYPDQKLPFEATFLAADPNALGPELRKVVIAYRKASLLPSYLQENKDVLLKEAGSIEPSRGAMEGLLNLYGELGIHDYDWQDFGPNRNKMSWWYHSFEPTEKWLHADDRLGRYREVTFPKGMEQWHTPAFDPAKAGWKTGLAPFGAADGKQEIISEHLAPCKNDFCACHDPINTLWENDVLLLSGKFEFPPFEEGYRYRLLHGMISHPGSGGGYRLYVNGKLLVEQKSGTDRRGGDVPIGRVIPKEMWSEFDNGPVTISAISFKKHHPRTKKFGGNLCFYMQRMKVPPLEEN
jgi:hypothetical protein